jgi:hypothetical protein
VDERDVLNTWRNLFVGKPITAESLHAAETMLEGLSGESPLHIRLASELKKRSEGTATGATSRRKVK